MCKIASVILIMTVLAVLAALGYVVATANAREKFTEFYVVGLEGKATHYPKSLKLGEEGKVIVGIVNRERETADYWLQVKIDSAGDNRIGPLKLEQNEKWEGIVTFVPGAAGDKQKVQFLLYRNGQSEPYRTLYLWVNVRE